MNVKAGQSVEASALRVWLQDCFERALFHVLDKHERCGRADMGNILSC